MDRRNKMANLIPIAGVGKRFSDAGYILPKPLITVSGVPMIIKAIRDMPKNDKWIFIVRQEHIDNYKIDKIIRTELPNAIIIPVEKATEGQVSTCLLAEPYLDPEDSLFIASCDNGYLYNKEKYEKLCNDLKVDCIVWTFTQRENLRRNPEAWGWVKLNNDGFTIRDMSIKVPISDVHYKDHAVVATFFFKKAKDFIDSAKMMIRENYRIKNEFYVDVLPIFLKKMGKRSVIFDVDLYIGWGIPHDLYEYEEIEYFCTRSLKPKDMTEEEKRLWPLWMEYFNKNK